MIKSDQNGIERYMRMGVSLLYSTNKIKSDQNGIERYDFRGLIARETE